MIVTEFYPGQGLGNQLWMYAVLRTLALDRGIPFGVQGPNRFKGRSFMDLDYGLPVVGPLHKLPGEDLPVGIDHRYVQPRCRHEETGADISLFDSSLANIPDSTKIEGNFESERYIRHRRDELSEWFASRFRLEVPDDTCVVSFRGGEYKYASELLLPRTYYERAMERMSQEVPGVRFVVITDDPALARRYFPDVTVLSHRRLPDLRRFGIQPATRAIGMDFTWVQRAKYVILSNSSFSWWGTWTNRRVERAIAPQYWARHNVSDGYWSTGDAITSGWSWLSPDGRLLSEEECRSELAAYLARYPQYSVNDSPGP